LSLNLFDYFSSLSQPLSCHPREGGDPALVQVRFFKFWIPAFAGMTTE